jgi:hypothetical protein
MQDDTHVAGNPQGYVGGKWKRRAAPAEDAEATLGAASVTLKQSARKIAEQQKEAGADQIGGIARAVHGAAREIEDKMPQAASFVHDAATRLEGAAASLRDRSVDDVFRSFNNVARSQPAAFFGGAVLAGFALSRFLKSSAEHGDDEEQR